MDADLQASENGGRRQVRIVLADDHPVVRRGLEQLLDGEAGFGIVGLAGDVPSVRRCLRELAPDILVLDLNMPGGSVLEILPELRAESPDSRIVVLTMHDDPAIARRALDAGAVGYVLKEAAETELLEAVRLAATGESFVSRSVATRLVVDRTLREGWD